MNINNAILVFFSDFDIKKKNDSIQKKRHYRCNKNSSSSESDVADKKRRRSRNRDW